MNLLHRWFSRHTHRCMMDVVDIALTARGGGHSPMTALRYRCILCGRDIVAPTETGLRLIAQGHPEDEVFGWCLEDSEDGDESAD